MRPAIIKYIVFVKIILVLAGNGYCEPENKALFDRGVIEFKAGRFQEAAQLFTEILTVSPEDIKALKNRGVSYMNLGEFDLAIEDFTKAIQINPDLRGVYSNLGAAWHYKGEYDKAIACYDKDIAQRPDVYITYFNRAISKAESKQLDEALVDIQKSLELKPDFESALEAKKEISKRITETKTDIRITKNGFTVQAGAFLIEQNAVDLKVGLEKSGFQARTEKIVDPKQKVWHLVRLGKGLDREEAEKICRELKSRLNIVASVRPDGKF